MAQVGFEPTKQPCIFLTTQSLRQAELEGFKPSQKAPKTFMLFNYIIAPKKNEAIETT